MRNKLVDTLYKISKNDRDVVVITADLGFGIFEKFESEFPKQFINCGVAEQNMTMIASGLALEGKKVFTYSIGNFPTLRCLEQIRNDVCYHKLNVTIIGMGGGFTYGQLGMSHHATEDLSILRSLPEMTVVAPSSLYQVEKSVEELYKLDGPSYLRIEKNAAIIDSEIQEFHLGRSYTIRDGNDVTMVTTGGILSEVIKSAEILSSKGIESRIISMPTVKPIDKKTILELSNQKMGIISIEENNTNGGLGSAIAEVCLENKVRPRFFYRIGLNDIYPSIVGDQDFLRRHYKMDANSIANRIIEVISASK